MLCIVTLTLLALPTAGEAAPQETPELPTAPAGSTAVTPTPDQGAAGLWSKRIIQTGAAPDDAAGKEKSVTAKVPATPTAPNETEAVEPEETPTPTISKEKNVTKSKPALVTWGITPDQNATETGEPATETATAIEGTDDDGTEETPTSNATPEQTVMKNASTDNGETALTSNTTVGESTTVTPTATEEEEDEGTDDDGGTEATPTMEKDVPPRPGATLARSHKSHHRPLVLSTHQVVSPKTTYTPGENRTTVAPATVVPRDGLIVSGVGVLLDRTPEDVALTRNGVEIANLDWLLDTAMHLGGRHPRVALEGETFTVTVTVEARNVTLAGEDPAYVVLVPPPGETGVYEITRTSEPGELRDGERAVWEFSVLTRTGRLTLEDLTLNEERQITNLTTNPEFFSFRAYALAGDQEHPSVGLSDPVIAIRPAGDGDVAGESPLPALYTLVGIHNSTLLPSETIPGAWMRDIGHDQIVTEAAGHLDALKSLGRDELTTLYAEEEMDGTEAPAAASSPLDLVVEFFSDLLGWLSGEA